MSVRRTRQEVHASASLIIGVGSAARIKDLPLSAAVVRPEFKLTASDGSEVKAHSTLQMETAQPGQHVRKQLVMSNVGEVPVHFQFKVNNFDIQPSSGRLQPAEQLPLWVSGVGSSSSASPAAAAVVLTEKCTLTVSGTSSIFNITLPCAEPIVSFTPQAVTFRTGFASETDLKAALSNGQLAPFSSQFIVTNTGNMLAKCELLQSSSITTTPTAFELAPGAQQEVIGYLHLDSLTSMPKHLQIQLATSSLATPHIAAKCIMKTKGPIMQCEPKTALNFGIIAPNSTATESFQVQNAGSKELSFRMTLSETSGMPGSKLALFQISTGGAAVLQPGTQHAGWKLRKNESRLFTVSITAGQAPCTWQAAITLKSGMQWELCSSPPGYQRFVHKLQVRLSHCQWLSNPHRCPMN